MTNLELLQAIAICGDIITAAPIGSQLRESIGEVRGRYLSALGNPQPSPPGSAEYVRELAAMSDWVAASEAAKDALGLPDTVRVFVVPESAGVTVDFGGAG